MTCGIDITPVPLCATPVMCALLLSLFMVFKTINSPSTSAGEALNFMAVSSVCQAEGEGQRSFFFMLLLKIITSSIV